MSKKKSKRQPWRRRRSANLWPAALIAGGALLTGLVAFAVWQAGGGAGPRVPLEVTGAPRLKLDQDSVDLGQVRLGRTVGVTFTVANVGDRQLRFAEKPFVEVVEGC